MLMALMLCINPTAFAEEEELELFAMTGGIEFVDFALYDADGVTNAGLISNSEMSVEVLVKNTKMTSRNYCVFAAVYSDDGTMTSVDYESGKFDGNAPLDFVSGTEWIKKVNLKVNVPEVTDNTVLKVMLFESPGILSPEGNIYYMADKKGKYICPYGIEIALKHCSKMQICEGIVTSVPYIGFADNGYNPDMTPQIEIKGDDYSIVADCSFVDFNGLLGKKVVAWIGTEADKETGNIMVYAISEKSDGNTKVKINATQFVTENDKEWDTEDKISYRIPGTTAVYSVELNDDTKYYVNYNEHTALNTTRSMAELFNEDYFGGSVEFISNDNDAIIEFVIIEACESESVIEKINEYDGCYEFELYNNGYLNKIDTNDKYFYAEFYRDGKKADVSSLEHGDTVSEVLVGTDAVIYHVSSAVIGGLIERYDESTVTINGKNYAISAFCKKESYEFKAVSGFFYLNVFNHIAYHREAETANYGMAMGIVFYEWDYAVQIMSADGTFAEYNLCDNAKFYGYDEDGIYTRLSHNNETTAEVLEQIISVNNCDSGLGKVKLRLCKAPNAVFDFEIKDGEIQSINMLQGGLHNDYLMADTYEYDAQNMRYGNLGFDRNTVIFEVKKEYLQESTDAVKADDVATGKVSDFFTNGDKNVTFTGLDEINGICKVVIGFDFDAKVPEDSDAVIVKGKKTVMYNGDDAVQITGVRAGEEVSFIIYNGDADYTNALPKDLDKGDVILIMPMDIDGIVSDFKLLYDASMKMIASYGDESHDIYYATGNLDKDATKNSSGKFFIDTNVLCNDKLWAAASDGIAIKAAANYTLVDYTESTKNPEISRKSAKTIFSTSAMYDTYVFVRVYDDVLSEVVCYRYLAE